MQHTYSLFWRFLLLFFLLGGWSVSAQQETTYALYKHHFNMINPAVSGVDGAEVNFSIRQQWQGVEGAPRTQALSIGFPHKNERMGLGFSVVNDRFNVEQQTFVALDFSYKLPLNNGNLFLGLKAGGNAYRLDISETKIYDANGLSTDPFLQSYSRFLPNLGVGMYYKDEKGFFSFSLPRLLNTHRQKEQDGVTTTATDRPHLFLSAGTRINMSDKMALVPSLLLSRVSGAPSLLTLDANMIFNNFFEAGLQYRTSGHWGGTALMHLNTFRFGYAYNATAQSGLGAIAATHEFVIKFRFGQTAAAPPAETSTPTNE